VHEHEELGLLPMVGPGRLEGNPVREERDEAARLLGEGVMAVEVVATPGGDVLGFAAGSPWLTSRVTAPLALQAFGARSSPSPCVLASARARTLESLLMAGAVAAPAVQTSGTMLLAGECPEGVGTAERVRRIHDRILAPRLAGAAVLLHTSLPARQVLACGLRPVRSLSSALDVMRDRAGGGGEISVIPDAAFTVPRVVSRTAPS
jgi:hypothetical protein